MNMEFNKALAAVLVAGITAYAAGFAGKALVHSPKLEKNAFEIAAAEESAGGVSAAAPKTAEPVDDLMASADPAQGEKVAKVCAACHTFDKGGANKVGPNIAGVVGRARASAPGFAYSDAMKGKGGAWDVASLNEFLFSPKAFVPGTKMVFAGLKKPEDRAALIKWMSQQK